MSELKLRPLEPFRSWLLNIALVFGMALAVGEADAGQDEEATEDLG